MFKGSNYIDPIRNATGFLYGTAVRWAGYAQADDASAQPLPTQSDDGVSGTGGSHAGSIPQELSGQGVELGDGQHSQEALRQADGAREALDSADVGGASPLNTGALALANGMTTPLSTSGHFGSQPANTPLQSGARHESASAFGGDPVIAAAFTGSPAQPIQTRTDVSVVQEDEWVLVKDVGKALCNPMPGSVLAHTGVLDKLEAHSQAVKRMLWPDSEGRPGFLGQARQLLGKLEGDPDRVRQPLPRDEIAKLVAAGERIALAIRNASAEQDLWPLSVKTDDGQTVDVFGDMFTTRALSWYMMSMSAMQDLTLSRHKLADTPSAMVIEGSFIMKDPGNRIYNFLLKSDGSNWRYSSHVNERSAAEVGMLGKPIQYGIEDFDCMLPGLGGAMLIDKLKGEELFVKFEHAGCPNILPRGNPTWTDAAWKVWYESLPAVVRTARHSMSFLSTRFAHGDDREGVRQEHVHKGLLHDPIHGPLKKLVDDFKHAGILGEGGSAKEFDALLQDIPKRGFPAVMNALAVLEEKAGAQQSGDLRKAVADLKSAVDGQIERLGRYSRLYAQEKGAKAGHVYDIQRRGAEVHISMDPLDR